MVLLGAIAGVVVVRGILIPGEDLFLLATTMGAITVLAVVELGMFLWFNYARARKGYVPNGLIAMGVALEANFPTAGLALVASNPDISLQEAVSAPVVLLYLLFVTLSALRLRPWVGLVAGCSAAAGYIGATIYLVMRMDTGETSATAEVIRRSTIIAIILILAGLLAALISRQILRYALAAIKDAMYRQKTEHDMAVARMIQQDLLPDNPPVIDGFDLAGHSTPADQTGGDFYDFIEMSDGRVVVILADVTGHGIGPALLTANLHAYMHALFNGDGSIKEWVDLLNEHLSRDLKEGRFVTFVAAVIAPGGAVSVLSAGHGPIFYIRPGGQVTELDAQGPPLGVIDGFQYEEPHNLSMQPGDTIALVTDGFFEWADPSNEQFGTDRLKQSLVKHRTAEADGIIRVVQADVLAFAAGTMQGDDLTAVVIKRLGDASGKISRQ